MSRAQKTTWDRLILFFNLGEMTAKRAITILFYVGIWPLFLQAYLIGRMAAEMFTYERFYSIIRDGREVFTSTMAKNEFLGFWVGVGAFLLLLLLWKVTCELLLIVFRCFETYVRKAQ